MPDFCPKCGAMVAEGTERCPHCGARIQPRVMDKRTGFTWADFFNYTLGTWFYVGLAIVLPVLLTLLCLLLYLRG